eukprot:14992-Heterococcus_DN1.PRE.3
MQMLEPKKTQVITTVVHDALRHIRTGQNDVARKSACDKLVSSCVVLIQCYIDSAVYAAKSAHRSYAHARHKQPSV